MSKHLAVFFLVFFIGACSNDDPPPTTPDASPSPVSCNELEDLAFGLAISGNFAACETIGETCSHGEECCCGACYPVQECECTEEGWVCAITDACFWPGCDAGTDTSTSSPVSPLDGGQSGTAPPTDAGRDATVPPLTDSGPNSGPDSAVETIQEAGTGSTSASTSTPDSSDACGPLPEGVDLEAQECCCGQCHPSMFCHCVGDTWACGYTDACFIPACPDGG